MKYKVTHDFRDEEDKDYIYRANDEYPRKGKKIEDVSKERIEALKTKNNKAKMILIEEIPEESNVSEQNNSGSKGKQNSEKKHE